jgi:DNA polymerase-3 subunit epsilon
VLAACMPLPGRLPMGHPGSVLGVGAGALLQAGSLQLERSGRTPLRCSAGPFVLPGTGAGRPLTPGTRGAASAHMTGMETLPGLNFTAIDFEAANSDRASACAVGITTVREGLIAGTESWLIRPHTGQESFDKYAMRVHRITPEMTAGAASLEASMFKLAALIGDGPVLAHNMGYDSDVLRRSFYIAGLKPPKNEFRCTETLARTALRLEKHKLHLVAEHLGLPDFQAHDAGADSLTCARIAIEIARRQGATTITGLYRGLGIA